MDDRIEETLRGMLADSSPEVRLAATGALDRVRARKGASSYRDKLKSGAAGERLQVVFAAEEIGGREGVSLLLAALADADIQVRGAAVRALGSFPGLDVLKALMAKLAEERGIVLCNIIEVLGKSGRKELGPVIERYLSNADEEVVGKAVVAYALLADPAGIVKILPLAKSRNDTIRASVAQALGEWSAP